jgi:hypothetical protein
MSHSFQASERTPQYFDVLLRHRLLPQPGGFEGLSLIHVALNADHVSIVHLKEDCRIGLELDPASPSTPELALQHDHTVTRINELFRLEPAFIPSLEVLFLKRVPDFLKTTRDGALPEAADGAMQLHVRTNHRSWQVPLSPDHGRVDHPHDLDVLLRHRPRSIAAREGQVEGAFPQTAGPHRPASERAPGMRRLQNPAPKHPAASRGGLAPARLRLGPSCRSSSRPPSRPLPSARGVGGACGAGRRT